MDDQTVFLRTSPQGTGQPEGLQQALCALRDEFANPATSPLLRSCQDAIASVRGTLDNIPLTVLQPLDLAIEGLASTLAAGPAGTVDRLVAGYRSLADRLRSDSLPPTSPSGPDAGTDPLMEAMDQVPLDEVGRALAETFLALRKEVEAMEASRLLTRMDASISEVRDQLVSDLKRTVYQPLAEGLGSLRSGIDTLPIAETTKDIETSLAALKDAQGKMKDGLRNLRGILSEWESLPTPPMLEDFLHEAGAFASKLATLAQGPLPAACIELLNGGMEQLPDDGKQILQGIGSESWFLKAGIVAAFQKGLKNLSEIFQNIVVQLDRICSELDAGVKTVLDPVSLALEAADQVAALDPQAWVSPLRSGMASLCDDLSTQSLEPRLGGIQERFETLMEALGRFDPDSWLITLRPLYQEIQDIYAALPAEVTGGTAGPLQKEKMRALDPIPVLSDMRTSAFLPLQERIASVDPSGLRNRIATLYRKLPEALGKSDADELAKVSAALKDCLEALRGAIATFRDDVPPLTAGLKDTLRSCVEIDLKSLSDRLADALGSLEKRFLEWCHQGDRALQAIAGQFGRLQARGVG